MRYKFIILFLFISFVSKAQVYQLMPQYGYSTYRMNFDSTIQIPTFCGVPKLGSNKINKGALAFDSCNNRFYFFNPKSQAWDTIKSGSTIDTTKFVRYTDTSAMLLPYLRKGDTIFLSQRIDQRVKYSDTSLMLQPYLKAVDTTNKWVNSVTKLNDSTIQVIKGTTTSNISISSVTSATRLITQVWNNTGATILRGSVVYISGRHSSNLPTIALAEGNNESNSYKTFALVDGDILDNSSGFVIQAGKITGLNLPTSSYTDGDILYLSPTVAGGYTTTKPLAPNHIVKLGSVTRAHPTQGSIEIKIENGWQLDELSDVQIAAVPADSVILQFSRVDSLWHDVSPLTAMGNRFVKRTDSAAMLQPYLRKSDTLSISNRINLKLNISDTSTMLSPYLRSNIAAGTYATIAQNNAKLNISDTSSMLSPYIRTNTANASYVTSVFRKTASDSVFFVRGGANNFAFRDSAGGANIYNTDGTLTGVRTLSVSNNSLTFGGSATAQSGTSNPFRISPTLTATANNDVLTALYINPTFTNSAFSNVANSYLRFGNAALSYFSPYQSGGTANDGLRLISNNNGATFGVQNTNSTGFAGIEYLSSTGAARVFTGFNNNDGQEFRFNNIASGGFIDFRLSGTSKIRLQSNGVVNIPDGATLGQAISATPTLANNEILNVRRDVNAQIFSSVVNNVNGTAASARMLVNATGPSDLTNGISMTYFSQNYSTSGIAIANTGSVNSPLDMTIGTVTSKYLSFWTNNTERARFLSTGELGIGTTSPSTSSALDITSTTKGFLQPRLTTTQMNAISTPATGLSVFNTTDSAVYIRRGTGAGWQQQAGQIFNTATLDFPNTLTQTSSDLTITLTGAVDGDVVVLGVPNAAMNANSNYSAWVSSANTVTVRFNNYGLLAINPASATFKVTIIK